jgi:steroid delta-isomerase-like uncharacterized protein
MADQTHINKSLSRRWFEEVWNQGRTRVIDELLAADCIAHGLGEEGQPLRGPEHFRRFYDQFRSAFPDVRIHVQEVLAEGDRTAVRFAAQATHTGHGIGVAPTGRPVNVTGMCIMRWADGQIVEAWNEFDAAALLRQITQTPPPATLRATV